ncbi:glutaminase [Sphingobacterium sp. lm-10]|uniref:glutaminase n=1 Tax=Sphingobacterium sp. lm-10 TaxID=2944904 RepID=UPI0020219287|nr:glutaminase [Sphingobacterium sp. lm-10]MCL7987115.1 glutaminase [Sphingobacterium sp. lm-10]
MNTPVPEYLADLLQNCKAAHGGELADYIPELASADPNKLAVALTTLDGLVYSAGDDDYEFSIQSISKAFAYAYVIEKLGLKAVLEKVGVEPSGEAFNEISLDQTDDKVKPKNPMINSGAITIHSLIPTTDSTDRAETILRFFSKLAGRDLSFDMAIYQSEKDTAFRNLSIGYSLRNLNILESDPIEIVESYVKQCSIKVTVKDLVNMIGVLVNGGILPKTGERIFSHLTVRQVLTVMTTCGMYNAAGDWLAAVGIPAKSGVSGGIIGVLPGQVGLAVFAPKLDRYGNSVRGIDIMQQMSSDMGLHLLEGIPSSRAIVNDEDITEVKQDVKVYKLQGVLQFSEAERLLRKLQDEDHGDNTIIFDLSHISLVNEVGRRMLLDGIDRLRADGHDIALVDPEHILPDAKTKLNFTPKIYEDLADISK